MKNCLQHSNLLASCKQQFIFLSFLLIFSACSNYYDPYAANRKNEELIFDDLSWTDTSDPLIIKIEIPEFNKSLSADDIISVRVNIKGYEMKAYYYQRVNGNNAYWYEIINHKIELYRAIENDLYDKTIPKITVTLKG